jgi:hypothetical protein
MNRLLAVGILVLSTMVAHAGMTAETLAENCSHIQETGTSQGLGIRTGLCLGYIDGFLRTAHGMLAERDGMIYKYTLLESFRDDDEQAISNVAHEFLRFVVTHPEFGDGPAALALIVMLQSDGSAHWTRVEGFRR